MRNGGLHAACLAALLVHSALACSDDDRDKRSARDAGVRDAALPDAHAPDAHPAPRDASASTNDARDAELDTGDHADAARMLDAGPSGKVEPRFATRILSADYYAEGADVGDIDGDGRVDLVAGPHWYAAPSFELSGSIVADPKKLGMDEYGEFFLVFVDDINADSRPDVIAVGIAGGDNGQPNTYWYENPGRDKLAQPWPKHLFFSDLVSNESPAYLNLVGDARPELVFMNGGRLGYARPNANPLQPWEFTSISGDVSYAGPYVHGLGVGDIDGDGMLDLVERTGYWRQVPNLPWERHEFEFWIGSSADRAGNWGGAQMYVIDIDGDRDADVVTTLAAHQYGVAWFEQQANGAFVGHSILSTQASSDNTSQLHALVMADINRDGLPDFVTGKRYYAHPSTTPDPGTTDAARLFWFELQRDASGAKFVQHVIHEDSGVGLDFVVRDLTGDGKVDIFTCSKRGTFLHVQQ